MSARGPLALMTDRLGRRGAFLTLLGLAWVLQGVSISQSVMPRPAPGMDLLLYERIPIPVRAGL